MHFLYFWFGTYHSNEVGLGYLREDWLGRQRVHKRLDVGHITFHFRGKLECALECALTFYSLGERWSLAESLGENHNNKRKEQIDEYQRTPSVAPDSG